MKKTKCLKKMGGNIPGGNFLSGIFPEEDSREANLKYGNYHVQPNLHQLTPQEVV